jgi:prepilin-type N-terminal cleavage/methylation domain-containing protein
MISRWCASIISEKGMTLLELIMVMLLVAILSGFVSNMIFFEIDTYEFIVNRQEMNQNSRMALRMISKDIRQIMASDSIFQASQDSIRFDTLDDFMISYKFIDNQIFRNADPLIKSVNSFKLSYFDISGNPLTVPVSNPSDIRSISISLTVSNNGQSFDVQTKVKPRNF